MGSTLSRGRNKFNSPVFHTIFSNLLHIKSNLSLDLEFFLHIGTQAFHDPKLLIFKISLNVSTVKTFPNPIFTLIKVFSSNRGPSRFIRDITCSGEKNLLKLLQGQMYFEQKTRTLATLLFSKKSLQLRSHFLNYAINPL